MVVLAAAVALASCGGSDDRPIALIASSLRHALDGARSDVRTSFASSSAIAAQIRQGADADVVIVADPAILTDLGPGLVGPAKLIARNAVAVLVPLGNPLGIRTLADLATPGRRVVVAAPRVPLGAYTRTVLASAHANAVRRNVVSEEPDAAGVVGKVVQGEVDAGIGYASDLAGGRVAGFVLPADVQVDVRYDAAVVTGSRRAAAAAEYVDWLVGGEGQAALGAAGFAAP